MTVITYFLKTVWRRKGLALVYSLVFLLLALANAGQGASEATLFEDSRLDVRIVNPNQDDVVASELVTYLSQHHDVHLVTTDDELTLKEQLYSGETDGVVILPNHLTASLREGQAATQVLIGKSSASQLLYQTVASYLRFSRALLDAGEYSPERIQAVMSQTASVEVSSAAEGATDSSWGQEYFAFTPFLYLAIFIGIFGMIFSEMKGARVTQRIQMAELSASRVAMEQFLGGLVTVGVFVLIYTVAAVVIQPSFFWDDAFVKSVLLSSACAVTSYALAFLLVTVIGESQYLYSAMSLLFGLGLSFISGIFVPVELLSDSVLKVSKLFPVYYAVEGIHASGSAFSTYSGDLAIVLAFGGVYLVAALAVNRVKQTAQV